jgi:hypothetical protein
VLLNILAADSGSTVDLLVSVPVVLYSFSPSTLYLV